VRIGVIVFACAATALGLLVPGDVGWRDSGEIGAAAATLGVAHPTGFPLDMMLLKLGELLPLGTLAFRQNLVVALVSAACLGTLAEVVAAIAGRLWLRGGAAGGALAAGVLLGWETFAGTALVVEVYSTGLLLVLATALELLGRRRTSVLGALLGFAAGAHVLAFAMVGLLASTQLRRTRSRLVPMAAVTAPVVLYLPLASGRNPPLDWGDPETLTRLWEHLSGARIRGAYGGEMLGGVEALRDLGAQLAELWPAGILVLVALRFGRRREVLGVVALLVLDVAYGTFVNPMGIVDRQVGHVAGAAVATLAGVGAAWLAAGRARWVAYVAAVAMAAPVAGAEAARSAHAGSELHGDGGTYAALPSRSLVLCSSDDACAIALFTRYAVGARPDVAVVVAQHLWEPRERARVGWGFRMEDPGRPSTPDDRGALALRLARRIALGGHGRPVRVEESSSAPGSAAWPPAELAVLGLSRRIRTVEDVEARYARRAPLEAERARRAWAQVFDEMGKSALRRGDGGEALRAFRRAVAVAPHRGAGWTNLGVVLLRGGALGEAERALRAAVSTEPERAAGWVNLVQVHVAGRDLEAARAVLQEAAERGVRDERLDEWGTRLEAAPR